MMSCILAFYIALCGVYGHDGLLARSRFTQNAAANARVDDADALYARRDDPESARQAAAIWTERLRKNPRDFEAAWKVSRARYWLGNHAPEDQRKAQFDAGVQAGKTAVSAKPNRPEGHFWMAANMGALAEALGAVQGLKLRNTIKNELQTVLRIDPAFQEGSADRALGRWYYKVPAMFGGAKKKSEEHLRRSLIYAPDSTASHYFLAETLVALDRKDEARAEAQKVLDAPLDRDWSPEDREFKERARALLAQLEGRRSG